MPVYSSLEPAGVMKPHGSSAVPGGYLLCDGSAVLRASYPRLFAAIGTNFGLGDGSTTFNLPDGRGRFFRGQDMAAGNDPDAAARTDVTGTITLGDVVGSYQLDMFASHAHSVNVYADAGSAGGLVHCSNGNAGFFGAPGTNGAGGNETRSKNFGGLFIIKY